VLDRCLGKTGRIEQADPDRVDVNESLLAEDRARQARSVGATGDVNYAEDSRSEPEKLAAFLNEVESLARQWEALGFTVLAIVRSSEVARYTRDDRY
jgi:hypothetical protein